MYKKFKSQKLRYRIRNYLRRPLDIMWLDLKINLRNLYRRVKALFLAPFPHDDIVFGKNREKDVEYMFQVKRDIRKYNTIEDAYKDYDEFIELSELLKDPKYKYVVRRFNGRLFYALYDNIFWQTYNDVFIIDTKLFEELIWKVEKLYRWWANKRDFNGNLIFYTDSWEKTKKIGTYYLLFLCLWFELMNDLRQRNYFIAHNICKLVKKDWIK